MIEVQGASVVIPTLPSGGTLTFTITGTAGNGASVTNVAANGDDLVGVPDDEDGANAVELAGFERGVPQTVTAVAGSYARFRFSTSNLGTAIGAAPNGEVEDCPITGAPQPVDFGDRPTRVRVSASATT